MKSTCFPKRIEDRAWKVPFLDFAASIRSADWSDFREINVLSMKGLGPAVPFGERYLILRNHLPGLLRKERGRLTVRTLAPVGLSEDVVGKLGSFLGLHLVADNLLELFHSEYRGLGCSG